MRFGVFSILVSHYPELWFNIDKKQNVLSLRLYKKEIKFEEVELMMRRLENGFDGDVTAQIDKITNCDDCIEIAVQIKHKGRTLSFD